MKHIVRFISIALILLFAGAVTFVSTSARMPMAPDDANHVDDEAAIRKLIADHNAAFNRHDGSGIVYFTDDAVTRNIGGAFFTGKAEIEKLSVALNKFFANIQRTETIQRIRFLTADIALVDSVADDTGYITTADGTKLPPAKGGMSFKVVVKKEGRWLITAVRNAMPARLGPPGSFPGTGTPNPQAQDAPKTPDDTNQSQDVAAIRKIIADGTDATTTAKADDSPFMGTWKLNLSKSKIIGPDGIRPLPLVKSIVTYELVRNEVQIADDDTFTDDHSIHMEWIGKFDGKDYPVTGDPTADSWSFEEIDGHTLGLTTKKDGKVIATRRVTVSADGKTRILTGTRADASGKTIAVTAVYEKD